MKTKIFIILISFSTSLPIFSQAKVFPGADQKTPSRSEYFSWINNTNEGATESQTLINLNFFKWLQNEYGMTLDIYAFDAGAIDGANFYGSDKSARFKKQFPTGFGNVTRKAAELNTRLGIWGGPDGFGDTPEEEAARTEMMVSLCRDYNWALFKQDAVCGQLRPEKYDAFDKMMTECRKFSPDLIYLNHRLNLGKGIVHATTSLLGGAETYIDVHMTNQVTAPHHRAAAISRELPKDMNRLTEDHGVCLSSCLDYWEDDLILQAFNRNLILAPEIYGNPWLLADAEFPKLARIFNLHKKYRSIMVNGFVLPEKNYGPNAVSRGDAKTRLITLRNLTWYPVKYKIAIDQSIGLTNKKKTNVIMYHPYEQNLGEFDYGKSVEIEVLPFRSCLIKVNNNPEDKELLIDGAKYEVVRDVPGKPVIVKLLSFPGESSSVKVIEGVRKFSSASIDGKSVPELVKKQRVAVKFEGDPYKNSYNRKLGNLDSCKMPADAESIYEATCFAADNNALEARSVLRSGETKIPEVKAARDAFFNQSVFVERELWDKYLFDGNVKNAFSLNMRWGSVELSGTVFRLDIGASIHLDSLIIKSFDGNSIQPLKVDEGIDILVSSDLKTWKPVKSLSGIKMVCDLRNIESVRYVKMSPGMMRITEIEGYANGRSLDRKNWRASNLFRNLVRRSYPVDRVFYPQKAWSNSFVLNEIPKNSYLCIAVNGQYGNEGVFAGVKIDGKYYGCPDRSPSFTSNTWELSVTKTDKNYTYYFPLTDNMKDKNIEIFAFQMNKTKVTITAEAFISAYPIPFIEKTLVLQ